MNSVQKYILSAFIFNPPQVNGPFLSKYSSQSEVGTPMPICPLAKYGIHRILYLLIFSRVNVLINIEKKALSKK